MAVEWMFHFCHHDGDDDDYCGGRDASEKLVDVVGKVGVVGIEQCFIPSDQA